MTILCFIDDFKNIVSPIVGTQFWMVCICLKISKKNNNFAGNFCS